MPLRRLQQPDIWGLYEAYSMAMSHGVAATLQPWLLETELLELNSAVGDLLLVNVVKVRNYLDHERTRWFGIEDGVEAGLLAEVPEFVAHRFGGPSLFRLPHDDVWLYCWEDSEDLGWSFRVAVAENGLSGLTFEEI